MVNRWLKRPPTDVYNWDTLSYARKSGINPTFWRRVPGQEVVLDRAIHRLLRVGDGKTCRGTLRDRSLGHRTPWSAHLTMGMRKAPFVGDKYARQPYHLHRRV